MLNALLTPIGIWHACCQPVPCLSCLIWHLCNTVLMSLLFLELLLHSPSFCIQRFHLLVAIEDLGVDLWLRATAWNAEK